MKNIKYIAYTADNKKVKGTEIVNNESELYSNLKNKGLFLSEIKDNTSMLDSKYKLSNKVLSEFCRQLGTLLLSGVPIFQAFNILGDVMGYKKKIKNICDEISLNIQKGNSISSSLIITGIFPEILINVVIAGEENGNLGESLISMAEYYENANNISSKIMMAMIYPAFLMVAVIVAIIVIFTFILPNLLKSISSITELPTVTKIVVTISNAFSSYGVFIILGIILLIVLIIAIFKTPSVKYQFDKFKLHIPYIGRLLKCLYTSRFASTFNSLYISGINIPRAIYLSSTTINNKYIEKQLKNGVSDLVVGQKICEILKNIDGLDKKLVAAIEIGEETGKIEEMLKPMASNLNMEAIRSVDTLLSLLEPATLLLIGMIILPLVLSVILPMLNLYSAL